jgi:hypothetical protein
MGTIGDQTASGGMGLIAYLSGDLPDPLPHLGADVGLVVDDPGDSGTRDAGQSGDIFECRGHRLLLEALPTKSQKKARVRAKKGV